MFIVVLTIKMYRGWNLSREKVIYFLTLCGAVAREYFHLYFKHLPEEQWDTEICKFEEKQGDGQNWELNVEVSFLI